MVKKGTLPICFTREEYGLIAEAYRKISACFIIDSKQHYGRKCISVTYENGQREILVTYDPRKWHFEYVEFIGLQKIEAAFLIDRRMQGQYEYFGKRP